MLKFIESLAKYAESNHWPQWTIQYIIQWGLPIIVLITSLKFILHFLRTFWNFRNTKILNKNVGESFRPAEVYDYTRYYVPTRYQNVPPSEDDEPGRNYIASAKEKLMPIFLNKVFNAKKDSEKYYLILADSGMGKTTFLINLIIKYKNKLQFPWSFPKYEIKLIALGSHNWEEIIAEIPQKGNTILLLDAFDEDTQADIDYASRLSLLLNITTQFKTIILTCRSQFFPSEKEEPFNTGYFTYGERGEYKFQKVHLSTFDNSTVRKYLLKRYNVLNPFSLIKYIKANKIVRKCNSLIVRPMLLSYIDELLNSKKEYFYSYQIYEDLINKWVVRESNKTGIIKKYKSAEQYQKKLYEFLKALALVLSKKEGNRIYKDEKFEVNGFLLSEYEKEYLLTEREVKSKSLLNRTSDGYYKFSHKSILEFFLAKHLIENKNNEKHFDLNKFDEAHKFYHQMIIQLTIKGYDGNYTLGNGISKPFSSIQPHEIIQIKTIFIKNLADTNPSFFKYFTNLNKIYIQNSSISNSGLYPLYLSYLRLIEEYTKSAKFTSDQTKFLNNLRNELFFLSDHRKLSRFPKIKKRLKELEDDCIVIEPFLLGSNFPEFQNYWKGISRQIKNAQNRWDNVEYLVSVYAKRKKQPTDLDYLFEDAFLMELNSYLVEIDNIKNEFPFCEVVY